MKLKTKDFREACTTIKNAIDTKGVSLYTETLELIANGDTTLHMNVTNREYYTSVAFTLEEASTFKAAVNAKLFLDLISKITTDDIDLSIEGKAVKVTGNGKYKVPMIYNGDNMMELPVITISNVTNTMNIPTNILDSIATHNSKELLRGVPVKPVQKYYYVDNQGCITFTSGACVNSFTLEKDIKLLLSDKVVKLFKLFNGATSVNFAIGQDALTEEITQTKVSFTTDKVTLTAIMSDSSLVSSVPVAAIRGMATQTYTYSVVVSKDELLDTLHRLMLFSEEKNYGTFTFTNDKITISDWSGENTEEVQLKDNCDALATTPYSAILNINGLELIVNGCEEDYLTLAFGDNKAIVVKKTTISDIIPELKVQA